jgi:hypothetical protein
MYLAKRAIAQPLRVNCRQCRQQGEITGCSRCRYRAAARQTNARPGKVANDIYRLAYLGQQTLQFSRFKNGRQGARPPVTDGSQLSVIHDLPSRKKLIIERRALPTSKTTLGQSGYAQEDIYYRGSLYRV